MEKDCVKIFKCLADKSRLLIINNLMQEPMYVELLAERLGLAAPTISFHLKKLEEIKLVYGVKEQYYVMYHLNEALLNQTLKELVFVETPETTLQAQREAQYEKNVIAAFFQYGKLKSIPVQLKKRKIILAEIVKRFERERSYTEKEVNLIIADFHDDFCTLRRELVNFKMLGRENGIYQRLE